MKKDKNIEGGEDSDKNKMNGNESNDDSDQIA
jgi:hypothetical protein